MTTYPGFPYLNLYLNICWLIFINYIMKRQNCRFWILGQSSVITIAFLVGGWVHRLVTSPPKKFSERWTKLFLNSSFLMCILYLIKNPRIVDRIRLAVVVSCVPFLDWVVLEVFDLDFLSYAEGTSTIYFLYQFMFDIPFVNGGFLGSNCNKIDGFDDFGEYLESSLFLLIVFSWIYFGKVLI